MKGKKPKLRQDPLEKDSAIKIQRFHYTSSPFSQTPDINIQSGYLYGTYPISNFVSYDKFSTNHKAFLVAITNNDEPKCFKQAAQDARWCEAIQKEVKALEKNGTWTLEYYLKENEL
nr:integrase, catalytic core [Tanacetum cinerariifolium]